jgi:hypothetical protein
MRKLESFSIKPDGCVIKPANGSQGNGIQVILGPMRGGWRGPMASVPCSKI